MPSGSDNRNHGLQKKVSAVGISVVDHIMIVDGFKRGEGSFHCEEYYTEGGGMAATALCAASKLGSRTRLFSRVGDDINADFIVDGLTNYGIDISGIVKMPGTKSTVSFVIVDKTTGEKQFYSEWIKPPFLGKLELDISLLEGTDVLLVDGHWTEGALQAVRWANDARAPVVADFKRLYEGLESLFPYINYFIVPRFFAEELTNCHDMPSILEELSRIQAGMPIVTAGAGGGAYLMNGICGKYRSYSIECVDSTGAGDAFHGAFCHFLARGADPARCLDLASAAGALNCRDFGGRSALPSTDELCGFLDSYGCDSSLP